MSMMPNVLCTQRKQARTMFPVAGRTVEAPSAIVPLGSESTGGVLVVRRVLAGGKERCCNVDCPCLCSGVGRGEENWCEGVHDQEGTSVPGGRLGEGRQGGRLVLTTAAGPLWFGDCSGGELRHHQAAAGDPRHQDSTRTVPGQQGQAPAQVSALPAPPVRPQVRPTVCGVCPAGSEDLCSV